MHQPIEYFQDLLFRLWVYAITTIDWTKVALVAGAIGAIALSWSRFMDLVDQWFLKTIESGYRGYALIMGIAIRYPWVKGWRLLVLPPFVYPQLLILFKIKEFTIQGRPLQIPEQTVIHKESGRAYRVSGSASIRFAKDGKHARISQVQKQNPDGITLMYIQGVIADTVVNADTALLESPQALNRGVETGCLFIIEETGTLVEDVVLATAVLNDAQMQKDGLVEIATAQAA